MVSISRCLQISSDHKVTHNPHSVLTADNRFPQPAVLCLGYCIDSYFGSTLYHYVLCVTRDMRLSTEVGEIPTSEITGPLLKLY